MAPRYRSHRTTSEVKIKTLLIFTRTNKNNMSVVWCKKAKMGQRDIWTNLILFDQFHKNVFMLLMLKRPMPMTQGDQINTDIGHFDNN